MLRIDDKNLKVLSQSGTIERFTKDGEEGYDIAIKLQFTNVDTQEKGYINLNAGFENNKDINRFLNREYRGIPFEHSDNQFIFFEVYDTEHFYDTEIESEIVINIKDLKDEKIEVSFNVNDELLRIEFMGYLDYIS